MGQKDEIAGVWVWFLSPGAAGGGSFVFGTGISRAGHGSVAGLVGESCFLCLQRPFFYLRRFLRDNFLAPVATGIEVGLLINFGKSVEIRRKIFRKSE